MSDEQRSSKLQTWIPIITVVVSVVSSIVASVITSRTSLQTKQLDADTQVSIDIRKYDFNREERKDKRLSENIPKLLSSNENERKTAKAIIVFFYPNEAQTVLDSVAATVGTEQRKELELDKTQIEAIKNQSYGIVIGGDTSLGSAQNEMTRARKSGYELVKVFYRQGYYRTLIVGFSTKDDADRANISVNAKIRDSSYVVNVDNWCPNAKSTNQGGVEYWDCPSK